MSVNYLTRARGAVCDYLAIKGYLATKGGNFKLDDLYVVWFSKTLQNWKALVSTDAFDEFEDLKGSYFEVTYNGDKNETYVDLYIKVDNVAFGGNK